jgi:tRNA(Arg) A34 adenosine deaminase TadA
MTRLEYVQKLKKTNADVAAIFFGDDVLYMAYEYKAGQPHSAVTKLIQNLTAGARGNSLAKETIYTTQLDLLPMDLGMAKLFGMWIQNREDRKNAPDRPAPTAVEDKYRPPQFLASKAKCGGQVNLLLQSDDYKKVHRLYLMAAFGVVSGKLSELASGTTGGHAIGAILVHSDGTIAGWSTNSNRRNKSQHAEVNLIQSYFARNKVDRLPNGAHIYSTLKPCAMCAAMIVSCAGQSYRVIYGQNDSGDFAANTALDQAKTSELIGTAISGQLHLIKTNFTQKGKKKGEPNAQVAGPRQPKERIGVDAALAGGYQRHKKVYGNDGGITGYLDMQGENATKNGKQDTYYQHKYTTAGSPVLPVIRHIEAFLKAIRAFQTMNW